MNLSRKTRSGKDLKMHFIIDVPQFELYLSVEIKFALEGKDSTLLSEH